MLQQVECRDGLQQYIIAYRAPPPHKATARISARVAICALLHGLVPPKVQRLGQIKRMGGDE